MLVLSEENHCPHRNCGEEESQFEERSELVRFSTHRARDGTGKIQKSYAEAGSWFVLVPGGVAELWQSSIPKLVREIWFDDKDTEQEQWAQD